MGVPTTLRGISGTAANNSPAGTDAIGSTADDYLRGMQASFRQYLAGQSSTVIAAATTDLTTATGHWVPISGNTTITGMGSEDAGIEYVLNFTGSPALIHSTALQLPGQATIQATVGDVCVAESLGSGNWKLWGYTPITGQMPPFTDSLSLIHGSSDSTKQARFEVDGLTTATTRVVTIPDRSLTIGEVLGTEVASTSGTSIDFTGIPAGTTRITINLVGVSTNGTALLRFQIGDSGGIETTGYLGASAVFSASSVSTANSTSGFDVGLSGAADVIHGSLMLTLENSSAFTWVASGNFSVSNTTGAAMVAGSKSTSATLDRVRITTANGADTFDAGVINISYQ